MNFSSIAPVRAAAIAGAAFGLAALAGCQGEKNVAHIGAASITEKVFNDRTQHIMQQDMLPIVDAGGSTLTRMILEEAANQIAKEKGYEPSAAAVTAFTNYQVKVDPNKRRAIEEGTIKAEDFEPVTRYNMEVFAIGTDGAKAKPEDVKKMYDDLKVQPALIPADQSKGQPARNNYVKVPAELVVKFVIAKDEASADKTLAQLKTNDDFKAAATTAGMTGPALDAAGQEAPLPADQIKKAQPDVYAALMQTPIGQYVSKPVPLANPDPKVPKSFLIAKMVKNNPEIVFTLEEASPALEQVMLDGQKPEWQEHQTTLLDERLDKIIHDGSIQINIDRYKTIPTKVIPLVIEESKKTMAQRAIQRQQQADQARQMEMMRAQQPPAGTPNPKGPQPGGRVNVRPVAPAPKPGGKP